MAVIFVIGAKDGFDSVGDAMLPAVEAVLFADGDFQIGQRIAYDAQIFGEFFAELV